MRAIFFGVVLIGLVAQQPAFAAAGAGHREYRFQSVSEIRFTSIIADCRIIGGSDSTVAVSVKFPAKWKADQFHPRVEQNGSVLSIRDMSNPRGRSPVAHWQIRVPAQVRIVMATVSGNLQAHGTSGMINANITSGNFSGSRLRGKVVIATTSGNVWIDSSRVDLKLGTASGNIYVRDGEGEIRATTASGGARISHFQGELNIKTASGDVEVERVRGKIGLSTASANISVVETVPTEPAAWHSASGNVMVTVSQPLAHDLKLSSSSGKVVLKLSGQPLEGTIQLIARRDKGKIEAPFPLPGVREFTDQGYRYIEKSAMLGKPEPHITLQTASGEVKIEP